MQFEALKVFCDVARNRSFSQAALLNQVTQSAVSQMIAQLERNMGVQLIDRTTRPLQLTPLGKSYYEGCKQLLENYNELVSSLRSAQARVEGTVQIAAIYSVGLGDMGEYIERFAEQAPEAEVHIEYLHPNQVYERVLEGSVDVGLVSFPRKMSKVVVLPWRDENMMLACPPDHQLAAKAGLKVGDLNNVKYVHFSKELVIRREVDRFLRSHKVTVNVALEFDNIENIKKALAISGGAALLPEPTFRHEVRDGSLVAIPLADVEFVRPLGIMHRRQHKLSKAVQEFLDLLRLDSNGELADGEPVLANDNTHPKATFASAHHQNGTAKSRVK